MNEHGIINPIWTVANPPDEAKVSEISNELGILPAAAALLCQRGCDTPKRARAYINDETARFFDPMRLADMSDAVKRIHEALEKREKILIYGDYDCDGVTSTAILYDYLRINSADVQFYIPDRIVDGYGVNAEIVRRYAALGFKLMITVDCGVTAVNEIALAKELGLDTVVTDHHECRKTLPDCPVVDPRRPDCTYPYKSLAGVGVTFKLICALEADLRMTTPINALGFAVKRYAEIITVGTIADVMPLTGENRTIVKYGLRRLENPSNLGLRKLLVAAGAAEETFGFKLRRRMTAALVAFTIAPRINAIGRLGNAREAVELLLTEFPERAAEISQALCDVNEIRQLNENAIYENAELMIQRQCRPGDRVLVVANRGWHVGVIGIVASRVTERHYLPSILIDVDDDCKGSGRSVKGFNLVAALEKCKDHLISYGGHEMAAGVKLKQSEIENFRRAINRVADEVFGDKMPEPMLEIDLELSLGEVNERLAKQLTLLEPFGTGNHQPIFRTRGMEIAEIVPLSGGRHTKLILNCQGQKFVGLWFGMKTENIRFGVGDAADVAYRLELNDFSGNPPIQLMIEDLIIH